LIEIAKRSLLLSIPEIASSAGMSSAVVMESQFKRTHDPYCAALIIGRKGPGKVDEK
jgi:hypothetical protein